MTRVTELGRRKHYGSVCTCSRLKCCEAILTALCMCLQTFSCFSNAELGAKKWATCVVSINSTTVGCNAV